MSRLGELAPDRTVSLICLYAFWKLKELGRCFYISIGWLFTRVKEEIESKGGTVVKALASR